MTRTDRCKQKALHTKTDWIHIFYHVIFHVYGRNNNMNANP